MPVVGRLISGQVDLFRVLKANRRRLHVLWNIDEDRTRSPGGRDVKRLFDRLRDLARISNQVVVFRDWLCDARDVGFLESVFADQVGGHLTGDRDEWHAIHVGGRNPRDEVRRPGT